MKWQRKGDGSYLLRREDRIKVVIIPQYYPNSRRAGCWILEIGIDQAEERGLIEVGTYPTLKMAKQVYFSILTESGNTDE